MLADVDALDQQLDDARLLGREQLVPERVEVLQGLPHLILAQAVDLRPFAARHVPTTISGARSRPRTWSMTAASISAAGSRPTGQPAVAPLLQHGLADVVAVEPAALAGVGRRHGAAGRAEDQPLQQGRRRGPRVGGALARALLQNGVHLVPQRPRDDRLVLAQGYAVPLWTASPT